ncbi:MAG: integrase core domain-containing protein [Trebonia sp.]
MSKARLVITAVTVEKRPVSEVARSCGVARSWICALLARYEADGEAAFEPRSRRPKTSPSATSPDTAALIVRLRKELAGQGLDAGPHHRLAPAAAPPGESLPGNGQPDPGPGPGHPGAGQAAEVVVHPVRRRDAQRVLAGRLHPLPLAGGAGTEILTWLDDHPRCVLSLTAHVRVTGADVLNTFRAACAAHGAPASTLTDNGMVFTTRLSGGRGGRNGLEHELRRLSIRQKNGKPGHPQTQGKVERFQQTMKNWLRAQPRQPATLAELQTLPGTLAAVYNTRRPHRSLQGRATPATAYAARPRAVPGDRAAGTHDRVRTDRIDATGLVTLRHSGKLLHIGIGRPHAGTRVLMLVQDLRVRVINAATGELIRELVLDPGKRYQPTGKPPGWPKKTPRPLRGFTVSSMS